MVTNHIALLDNPYREPVQQWLSERYGEQNAASIWENVAQNYESNLAQAPDYGGKKNGHARAIYGALLVFALYEALPDQPPIAELQDFVQNMFMGPFVTLGKVVDLNHAPCMWLIDKVFQRSGKKDREQIKRWSAGFVNVNEPYDRKRRASRYHFTQCPVAEFAKANGLTHVLPLMCNSDFFGIEQIGGRLIRQGTCGNASRCDYLVVGRDSPLAAEWETVTDERGFLVSRKRGNLGTLRLVAVLSAFCHAPASD